MHEKYICIGLNCSVYVFGSSSGGVCPSCFEAGQQVHPNQKQTFLTWYEKARSRPITR